MKTIISIIIGLMSLVFIGAQEGNESPEVVIISGDESLSKENVEIIIKKNGKKIKVDPEKVQIISSREHAMSFQFGPGSMSQFFDMNGFDLEDIQGRFEGIFEQFGDFPSFMNPLQPQRGESLEDFNREFEELGKEKSNSNKIEIGEGSDTYILKSDDGGPIIEEEKEIVIRKKHLDHEEELGMKEMLDFKEGKPLIFLNGKEFSGTMDDIDSNDIVSVQVEKGTSVIQKFGEKGKNGVVYVRTQ